MEEGREWKRRNHYMEGYLEFEIYFSKNQIENILFIWLCFRNYFWTFYETGVNFFKFS